VRQYPGLFGKSDFLAEYPYALPNIVIASLLLLIGVIGLLFLRETIESKRDENDLYLRIGQFPKRFVKAMFCRGSRTSDQYERLQHRDAEASVVLDDESYFSHNEDNPVKHSRASRSFDSIPRIDQLATNQETTFIGRQSETPSQRRPFKEIFTRHVVLNILVFAGLAMHTYTFDQLFSLLCSTEISDGGLAMTPRQIGIALSISGIMAMTLQFTLFPWGLKKCGEVFCLRIALALYCILYVV
jgi:hypothetical protein